MKKSSKKENSKIESPLPIPFVSLRYKILCDGKLIASFLNPSDRDLCMGTLEETYDDSIFKPKDDLV